MFQLRLKNARKFEPFIFLLFVLHKLLKINMLIVGLELSEYLNLRKFSIISRKNDEVIQTAPFKDKSFNLLLFSD